MNRLTIEVITAIEPEVGAILREAKREAHRRESIDDLYRRYKGRLSRLVGWHSLHEELQDPWQYETVIEALCAALDY